MSVNAAMLTRVSVALAFLMVIQVALSACSCNCPEHAPCVGGCDTCITTSSCTCTSNCTADLCPSNYVEKVNETCFTDCCSSQGAGTKQRVCSRTDCALVNTSVCATCKPGYYGPSCLPCPGNATTPCSGNGVCSDGIAGTGECTCNSNAAGPACEYTDEEYCHGLGKARYHTTGPTCQCIGYPGHSVYLGGSEFRCGRCMYGYYDYPNCRYCSLIFTCNIHGSCNETGYCKCDHRFAGLNCDTCAENYYDYASGCKFCSKNETCSGKGTCNSLGACVCQERHVGANCNQCEANYYSNEATNFDCVPCPNGASAPCGGPLQGTCDDGFNKTGLCTCNHPYRGSKCLDPSITSLSPTAVLTEGSETLTIHGVLFGNGGSVVVRNATNAFVCPVFQWFDTFVTCRPPAGQGKAYEVILTRNDGVSSQTSALEYKDPVLTGFNPASGPTAGGTVITLLGQSFGTYGGFVVWNSVTLQLVSQNPPTVTLPAGFGNNSVVTYCVTTVGVTQCSGALRSFLYDRPEIESIVPSTSSTDGSVIVITGKNLGFGTSQADDVLRVSTTAPGSPTQPCPIVNYINRSPTRVECQVAPGVGVGVIVRAYIPSLAPHEAGPKSTSSALSYLGPVVQSVYGCSVNSANTTSDCSTSGGTILTISGSNFGRQEDLSMSPLTVLVGGKPCTAVTVVIPHRNLTCVSPSGFTFGVDVTLQRAGYTNAVLHNALSYLAPKIDANSLVFANNATSPVHHLVTNTTAGQDVVSFTGAFPGATTANVFVNYGSPSRSSSGPFTVDAVAGLFNCSVLSVSTTAITCRTSSGIGKGLVFQVYVGGTPSAFSTDTYSYPAPSLTLGRLRKQGGAYQSSVIGDTTEGQNIEFEGQNFGVASLLNSNLLSVTIGTPSDPARYPCFVDFVLTTAAFVRCQVGPGSGSSLQIFVNTGPVGARWTVQGPNNYSYPTTATVTSVSGCAAGPGSSTIDCPTDGLDVVTRQPIRLVISGIDFDGPSALVTVGGRFCTGVTYSGTTQLSCVLPSGAGLNQAVVVEQLGLTSKAVNLVSYHIPVVSAVTGCPQVEGNNTINCPRAGNTTITITGTNFGASQARISIGASLCVNVTHVSSDPHGKVTCVLPAGTGLQRSISLLQDCGSSNEGGPHISYDECAAGHHLIPGTTSCTACLPGKFSSVAGQTACQDCPVGTSAGGYSSTACSKCTTGRFSSIVGNVNCSLCSVGKFAAQAGQVACTECPLGLYAASNGSTVCEQCVFGKYQDDVGQSSCKDCPVGTSNQALGQAICSKCVAGTYAPKLGQQTCLPCPAGNTSQSVSGSSSCKQCAPGTFSNVEGLVVCLACATGTYSNRNGSTTCTACEPGRFAGTQGLTACTGCSEGKSQVALGQALCLDCRAGTYQNETGQSVCIQCSRGLRQPTTGASVCLACEPGTFTDVIGQPSCKPCPSGTAQNQTGRSSCIDCPAGSFSREGASLCETCDVGRFSTAASAICTDCPAGRSNPNVNQSQCQPCGSGTVAINAGLTTCSACPNGTYAFENRCLLCDIGTFNSVPGRTVCSLCPPGRFVGPTADKRGASVCEPCEVGKSTQQFGAVACTSCPVGTFAGTTGMSACLKCGTGRLSRQRGSTGASICTDCDPGRVNAFEGSGECVMCEPGYHMPFSGKTECQPCGAGTYQDERGASKCKDCQEGSANSANNQNQCKLCNPGAFANQTGLRECFPCPKGRASNTFGNVICASCPSGRFQDSPGQQACVDCQLGHAVAVNGSDTCHPCTPGRASSITGASVCTKCTRGRHAAGNGLTTCSDCGEGRFANVSGLIDCFYCSPGDYQNTQGKSSCTACEAGRYAKPVLGQLGASTCVDCSPGSYAPTGGRVDSCLPCDSGRFQDLTFAQACKPCPIGTDAKVPGGTKCSDCTGNLIAPQEGTVSCIQCPALSIPNDARSACLCEPGFYSSRREDNTSLSFSCLECPKGANCVNAGNTYEGLQTSGGWWRVSNKSLEFYRCLLPEHCIGGSTGTCDDNREGPLCANCKEGFRSATGTSGCEECPSRSASVGISMLILAGSFLGFIFMYFVVLKSDNHALETMRSEKTDSKKDLFAVDEDVVGFPSIPEENGPSTVNKSEDDDQFIFTKHGFKPTGQRINTPNITYKMKILISFFQITSGMAFIPDLPWPSHYRNFIKTFQFFSLDFIPWQSMGCVAYLDYYEKLLVVTITPVVILVSLCLFFALPMYYINHHDYRDDNSRRVARKVTTRKFIKLVLFTVFLLYPNVSATVINFFVCKNIAGTWYLLADFTLECYDTRWMQFLGVVIVFVLVYPVGIPSIFGMLLYRNRKRFHEIAMRMQLGFLYEAYTPSMYYFELMDMGVKLCMISFVNFFPRELQLPFAMLVIMAYSCFILVNQPYLRKSDDRLALLSNTEIFLIVLAGFILLDYEDSSGGLPAKTDLLMSIVLILITISFVVVFVVLVLKNAKKMYHAYKRRGKIAKFKKKKRTRQGRAYTEEMQLGITRDETSGSHVVTSNGKKVAVLDQRSSSAAYTIVAPPPTDPVPGRAKQRGGEDLQFSFNPVFLERLEASEANRKDTDASVDERDRWLSMSQPTSSQADPETSNYKPDFEAISAD